MDPERVLTPPLLARIETRQARVVVVGAGYVGLPLGVEIARAGFPTTALDSDPARAQAITEGRSYVADLPSALVGELVASGRLAATSQAEVLAEAEVVIVCVPTPLNKTRDPDTSFILAASAEIARHMRGPTLVVLESTTFPGFTREVLLPRLATADRALDEDFFLAFSPERVDPGNQRWRVRNTPKVLGGLSPRSQEMAVALYRTFVDRVVPVSSADAAEMVKLLENTFRAVNIALVNEIAIMCGRLGLDTSEVIEAAATKPFGFMPFFPGPGTGGHCIPVDPLYLSWKLATLKYNARFIALADEINSSMPEVVAARVAEALDARGRPVRGARVLLAGVAYKRDIGDVRESPALDVMDLLARRGAHLAYTDPHVEGLPAGVGPWPRVGLDLVEEFDCVVITTDHGGIDYEDLVQRARLVVDTRNATRAIRDRYPGKVVTL